MIELAYINYEWKIDQSTDRKFREKTGLDISNVLWKYWEAYSKSMTDSSLALMVNTTIINNEEDAAYLFYCVFNSANSCVSLEEITDAVHRTSNIPSDNDELSKSWFIVMVQLAQQVSEYRENINKPKKKADT